MCIHLPLYVLQKRMEERSANRSIRCERCEPWAVASRLQGYREAIIQAPHAAKEMPLTTPRLKR
jgi:hypothetical protein